MSPESREASTSRRDRQIAGMDRLIALGEKMRAAEKVWMDDPWDGETAGPDEDRAIRKRDRFFRAEEAVSRAIPKFLKTLGVDGFV